MNDKGVCFWVKKRSGEEGSTSTVSTNDGGINHVTIDARQQKWYREGPKKMHF